jgi:hypothetical protein
MTNQLQELKADYAKGQVGQSIYNRQIEKGVFIASLRFRGREYGKTNLKKAAQCYNEATKVESENFFNCVDDKMLASAIEHEALNVSKSNNLDMVHDWMQIANLIK